MNKQNFSEIGNEMYELICKLFPIFRSITGDGVRDTLKIIKEIIPIEIFEIESKTKVFDWEIPKEWNIKDAWIKDASGKKIIDIQKSNLHIVSYSIPIHKKIKFDELRKHLHYLKEQPNMIPYKTSYYKETWGFCLTYNQYKTLKNEEYEIFINSKLDHGSLTYGEFFIKGKKDDEVLITCYVCHPSMCNDNLSGISLVTYLAKKISSLETRYSYRFLFIPETIGAITWLSLNENKTSQIKQGLVATCLGDGGISTYKKTKSGDSLIDKIVIKVLKESNSPFNVLDFFPSGSDERQFSSPGFDLSVGSLMRTPYGHFEEYHTSGDDLNFVKPEFLQDTFEKYYKIIELLENENSISNEKILPLEKNENLSEKYISLNPKCEPQLGKRGLYRTIGGQNVSNIDEMSIFWLMCFSDGNHSLKNISNISGIDFNKLKNTAKVLCEKNLLKSIN